MGKSSMLLYFHTCLAVQKARSLEKGPLQMLELYEKCEGNFQLINFNRDRFKKRLSCLKAGPYFGQSWNGSGVTMKNQRV